MRESDGLTLDPGALVAALEYAAGILVRTGKFCPEDERDAEIGPAHVVDDFAAAVDAILQP